MPDLATLPWRTGRTFDRSVWAVVHPSGQGSPDDIFLGIFDTAELAAHVVEMHNFHYQQSHKPDGGSAS